MFKRFAIVLIAMFGLVVGGCSTTADQAVEFTQDTIIIDVRSPGEFADGHLEGAQLLDLNSGQFSAALPGLDPQVAYVVYCRSGNRSAQAVAMMEEAGFDDVTDLGSLKQAADATGIAIVK